MTMPVLTFALIRVSILFNSLFEQNRINDTIAKNTTKGLWHSLTKLKVSDCKLGDIVLTTAGSVFEILTLSKNSSLVIFFVISLLPYI
jgi:hypothetical protein